MAEGRTDVGRQNEFKTGRVVILASAAALGGFLFGFDSAVINGAVGAVQSAFDVGPALIGFAVSSALLGSAMGAWSAGKLADKISRVSTMLVAAGLFVVSAIGSGFAFGIWDLTFWRFIGGIAVGVASVVAPMYIAEIAPAELRGRLGSLQQLAIVTGIFVALLVAYAITVAAGGSASNTIAGLEAWRWMFLSEVVPAVGYGALALVIPKSPRWLILQGRDEEARNVLDQIEPGVGQIRVAEIRASLAGAHSARLADIRGPRFGLLPLVWVGITLSVLQQFVGINVIFYYSSVLWQSVGFEESQSLLISTITGVINIVTTLVAIALVDKVGRRPLLLVGSAGMTVSLGVLAAAFSTATVIDGQPTLADPWGPVALVAANLFVVFFGFSWGPVVWVLLGELSPNRYRAMALSVAAAAQWVANFVVSFTFPTLKDIGLGLAYGIYTTFAALSFVFVVTTVKETKGKRLEEMEG